MSTAQVTIFGAALVVMLVGGYGIGALVSREDRDYWRRRWTGADLSRKGWERRAVAAEGALAQLREAVSRPVHLAAFSVVGSSDTVTSCGAVVDTRRTVDTALAATRPECCWNRG